MKLKKIRIQNFRNLNDITIDLNDVNLLIGPNNAGKSNVLHAIRLGSMIVQWNLKNPIDVKYANPIEASDYNSWLLSTGIKPDSNPCILQFQFELDKSTNSDLHLACKILYKNQNLSMEVSIGVTRRGQYIPELQEMGKRIFGIQEYKFLYLDIPIEIRLRPNDMSYSTLFRDNMEYVFQLTDSNFLSQVHKVIQQFVNFPIYEISPKEMRKPYGLTSDTFIKFDGSNIVSFLDYLNSSREDIKEAIKKTLQLITKDFSGYRLEGLKEISLEIRNKFKNDTIKKFGLIDSKNYENTIWAESISDGILYFLALLCIVHQPYPPPILLLEEPEKGIHPRRIREVMDLLFALAHEKNIQIILTTHSTFVVNEFKEVPENVTVFENSNGAITAQNLKNDILKKIDSDLEKEGYEKEDLTDALGENWALGLLGGVPV